MRNAARIAFLMALCGIPSSWAEETSNAPVTGMIFDYADIPVEVLHAGLSQTHRILQSGGVHAAWIHCPAAPERLALEKHCQDPAGPLTLILHILPSGASRRQT